MEKPTYQKMKVYAWIQCDGYCSYCGEPLNPFSDFIVEHMTPKSRGGEDFFDNIVGSCNSCNCSKQTKTVEEFREHLKNKFNTASIQFWFEFLLQIAMTTPDRLYYETTKLWEEWGKTQKHSWATLMMPEEVNEMV